MVDVKQKVDNKTEMELNDTHPDLKLDLSKLLEYTKNTPEDRIIIELLYVTGVRVSELLNIKKSHIKFDTHQIRIWNGKKERFVLITCEFSERLKQYISQYCDKESPFLFSIKNGTQKSNTWVTKLFRKYPKASNIKVIHA